MFILQLIKTLDPSERKKSKFWFSSIYPMEISFSRYTIKRIQSRSMLGLQCEIATSDILADKVSVKILTFLEDTCRAFGILNSLHHTVVLFKESFLVIV